MKRACSRYRGRPSGFPALAMTIGTQPWGSRVAIFVIMAIVLLVRPAGLFAREI